MTGHKKAFLMATVFFLLCGGGWALYWAIWGQYLETTNDAYVTGNMVMVTPQEAGIITTILADNTQLVEAGQVIALLDPHDYEIALEKAKADLGNAVREVVQFFLKVGELQAKKGVAESDLVRAELDYNHRLALVQDQSVSKEDFEHSETTLMGMQARLEEVIKELESAKAEVQNTTPFTHPKVEQAKATLKTAYLRLYRCKVKAPTRGIITQRKAQVGEWVKPYDPLMALVPIDQIWVDANFREVSLKNLRIGQVVEMFSDMYGRELKFHGRVVGLNPGTGSVFSILPPQNATGNWIKIVQRVPVKITLDPAELALSPLILGLSMTVKVDTHDRAGLRLPQKTEEAPIYLSEIYEDELVAVEPIIEEIIQKNL